MKIGSAKWKRLIIDGAGEMGIAVAPEKTDQFAIHAEELLRWTQKINLTAITDPLEVAVKHYLDSIAPAGMIPLDAAVLDMGSGGGFPGIPSVNVGISPPPILALSATSAANTPCRLPFEKSSPLRSSATL